jgi:signal transduction histidine kinase
MNINPPINRSKEIRLETLEELMRLTVAASSFEDLALKIVEKCASLLHAELCTLWPRIREREQDKLVLGGSEGFRRKPGEKIPIYTLNWDARNDKDIEGVTAWIAIRRIPYRVNSFIELKKHASHRGSWDEMQWDAQADKRFRSLIGIPLLVEDNVVGVLKWENSLNPEGFSDDDFNLAKDLAPFIAIALQAMNVREEHEKNRQGILKGLTVALLSPFEPKKLYKQIVDTTADLLYADLCSMWLCDSDRRVLRLAAAHGVRSKEEDVPVYQLNWGAKYDKDIQGVTAWVAIRGKPYFARYFEDLAKHPSHRGAWDSAQWDGQPDKHFGSLYAAPLIVNNLVHGVLKIERSQEKPSFSDVDKAIFDVMANFIELALDLSSRLRQDVVFDFFHLLKQPASNCLMSFSELRRELNRQDGIRPERIEKRLDELSRNLQSIRGWTNNVYALASGRVTGRDEVAAEIKVQKLLDDVIRELKYVFPDFECEIGKEIESYQLLLTPLEEKKFHVILFNILDNSIKFSAKQYKVYISVAQNNNLLALTIKDTGQGIPIDEIPLIFDAYFKRSVKKWPESMGLGLTTVDRLLKEFNWTKHVMSKINEGTEFTIFVSEDRWRNYESNF